LNMESHRILVIDDEEMIRESLVEFLDEHGYEAVPAVDGRDALKKLADSSPRPCLILLDLMMPVMDGRSFREQQLQDPDLSAIPVIVLSAYRDVARNATELNVAGYLEKPLKLQTLLQLVRQHCTGGAAEPTARS
jgi:CheY-like chemotaxis protein